MNDYDHEHDNMVSGIHDDVDNYYHLGRARPTSPAEVQVVSLSGETFLLVWCVLCSQSLLR